MNDEIRADLASLPGADLILCGIDDLERGEVTELALLALIGGARLRAAGLPVPEWTDLVGPFEHRLYEILEETHGQAAYGRYNSLLRRLASFAGALESSRR